MTTPRLPPPCFRNCKGSDFRSLKGSEAKASRPPPRAAPRQGEPPPAPLGGLRPPPPSAERRRGAPTRSADQVGSFLTASKGKDGVKEKFLCIGREGETKEGMTATTATHSRAGGGPAQSAGRGAGPAALRMGSSALRWSPKAVLIDSEQTGHRQRDKTNTKKQCKPTAKLM